MNLFMASTFCLHLENNKFYINFGFMHIFLIPFIHTTPLPSFYQINLSSCGDPVISTYLQAVLKTSIDPDQLALYRF